MNLQQLRYLQGVRANNLNISQAAAALHTSQPGISRQIKALEEELGVELFERNGRQLTRITNAGQEIFHHVDQILLHIASMRARAEEARSPDHGQLSIATTHTQARDILPRVIGSFRRDYSGVQVQLHQGAPAQIAEMLHDGDVDIAIVTEAAEFFEGFVMMPCYQWNRCLVLPHNHALATAPHISLEQVAQYPLLSYAYGNNRQTPVDLAFQAAGITPNVVFSATDADVIKTYIRLGLGISVLASSAFEDVSDHGLVKRDVSHLFEPGVTKLGFRKGFFLKRYHYSFINLFAPHLTEAVVRSAQKSSHEAQRKWLFVDESLPVL